MPRILLLSAALLSGCTTAGPAVRPEGVPKPAWENCRNDAERIVEREGLAALLDEDELACMRAMLAASCLEEFFNRARDDADAVNFAVRWPGVYDYGQFLRSKKESYESLCRSVMAANSRFTAELYRQLGKNLGRWSAQASPSRQQACPLECL
jgi:hypothetical protein